MTSASARAFATQYHEHVIQLISRLIRQSDLHDARNQALVRTAEEVAHHLNQLGVHTGGWISVFFDERDVYINGQPLRAPRQVYELAEVLGARFARSGINELQLETPLVVSDLQRLIAANQQGLALTSMEKAISPRIRVRKREATLFMAIEQSLEPQELVARTCAAALVVIERFYEGMRRGDYSAARHVKRIARNLVLLCERYPRLLLSFVGSLPDRGDVNTFAVKGALLSIITLRQITRDLRNLTDVAMTALLHDVGAIRARGLMRVAEQQGVISLPDVNDPDVRRGAPEASASMMALIGAMGEAALSRSVYLYEAHWLENRMERGVLYRGQAKATLEGMVIATVRRFLELSSELANHDEGTNPLQSQLDAAIVELKKGVSAHLEKLVISLFLEGMGLHERGTPVLLTSGWVGVVVANHERPSCFSRPLVRVVRDHLGNTLSRPRDVDLSLPTQEAAKLGCVAGVIAHVDAPLARVREEIANSTARKRAPVRLFEVSSALDESPPGDDDTSNAEESLAILESLSQIRKAPLFLSDENELPPLLQDIEPIAPEAESVASGSMPSLSWGPDENTSTHAGSDRIQMLNIADIAHMVPDELANQDFTPLPPSIAQQQRPVMPKLPPPGVPIQPDAMFPFVSHFSSQDQDSLLGSGPVSLGPETWNSLKDGLEDASEVDTSNTTSASDNLFILSPSFDPEGVSFHDSTATRLLPSDVLAAFQSLDRRHRDAEVSEASSDEPDGDDQG